jgi:Transglutaminase-like superfamily
VVRLGLWLGILPLRLRRYTLPTLLQRLTPERSRPPRCRPIEMGRMVRFVVWLCQRRCFRIRLFPKACLRQTLALYYVLTRLGYPVVMHFGILKKGGVLIGHSWVTLTGQPVAEDMHTQIFQIVYSYPTVASRGTSAEGGPCGAAELFL